MIGEGFVFGAAAAGAALPLVCAGLNVMAVGKATRAVVGGGAPRGRCAHDCIFISFVNAIYDGVECMREGGRRARGQLRIIMSSHPH